MIVPAPGRLSTTTCCPQLSVNFCPKSRASVSLPPPGGYGTMSRTGRAGYAPADSFAAGAAYAAAAPSARATVSHAATCMIGVLGGGVVTVAVTIHQLPE